MSYAMQGHLRWMDHSWEFRQNVVHWKREWQTTPVFLPGEPHERYEFLKNDTRRLTPQAEGAQNATQEK